MVRVAGISESIYGNAFYDVESFPSGLASTTYDSIGFVISFDYVSAFIKEKTALPFMMNSAYACSPSIDADYISSINITSNADYDILHKSGTSLNDIFVVSYGSDVILPIDEYKNTFNFYNDKILMIMAIAPGFEGGYQQRSGSLNNRKTIR